VRALKSGPASESVEPFHLFMYSILVPCTSSEDADEYSKWNESSECLFALSALREDGNFDPPHDVTQMFAQTTYHIRGAILFEGYRIKGDFGNDLVR
jgi:hypothetical protein